jgi:hypothetical protein
MVDSVQSWYRGAVVSIKDLRPGTVIRDEVIPSLLCKKRILPAFVTINVIDFWQKIAIDSRFCVICITCLSFLPCQKRFSADNNLEINGNEQDTYSG